MFERKTTFRNNRDDFESSPGYMFINVYKTIANRKFLTAVKI